MEEDRDGDGEIDRERERKRESEREVVLPKSLPMLPPLTVSIIEDHCCLMSPVPSSSC